MSRTAAPPAVLRNRIVGQAEVPPGDLIANPNNWRTHPKAQREALAGALEEVGWVQQVLVNTTTGRMVDGHARAEEALRRGEPTVPVLYVELSEAEEALVLATLDPIAAMADADPAKLSSLLAEIRVDDDGLRHLLGNLAGPDERQQGLTDPDAAPDVPAEPFVRRGELWALGDHRLLCGDATAAEDVDRVTGGEPVDVLWTDPPYGVGYVGATPEALTIENDDLAPDALRALVRRSLELVPLRPGGAFYLASPSGPLCVEFVLAIREAGLRHSQTLAWVKNAFVLGRADFHYRHESIHTGFSPDDAVPLAGKEHEAVHYGWQPGRSHLFHGGRKLDTVWEIARPSRSAEHPTMKPVELVARALEYSSPPVIASWTRSRDPGPP